MDNRFQVVLPKAGEAVPPSWAVGEQTNGVWYHQNELGEHFIAKRDGAELVISGQELEWEEIHLTLGQAQEAALWLESRIVGTILTKLGGIGMATDFRKLAVSKGLTFRSPLSEVIWQYGELLWLSATIESALPAMVRDAGLVTASA